MLTGAPPMLVVGLALHALWIPLALLLHVLDLDLSREHYDATLIVLFVGNIAITVGAFELARRSRGRARDGAGVAVLAGAVIIGVTVVSSLTWSGWMPNQSHWIAAVVRWALPIGQVVAVLGFAIAAGSRQALTSVLAGFATIVLFPIPPLGDVINKHLPPSGEWLYLMYGGVLLGRSIALVRLGVVIAMAARPVIGDHVRAARGLRWAAIGSGLRAAAGGAIVAFAKVGGTEGSKPAMLLVAFQLVTMAAMVMACWTVARAQLATLPRYLAHAAFVFALGTLAGMLNVQMAIYIGDHVTTYVPTWVQLCGTLSVGWMVIVVGVYSRHARALVRVASGCGAAFTLASCTAVALGTSTVATSVAIAGNLVVIPLFVKAARVVANDPVKTTADVFA